MSFIHKALRLQKPWRFGLKLCVFLLGVRLLGQGVLLRTDVVHKDQNHIFGLINTSRISTVLSVSHDDKRDPAEHPVSQNRSMTILYWTPFFNQKSWYGYGDALGRCAFKCSVTSSKSAYNTSDVVLFHFRDLPPVHMLPKHRVPHQFWVLATMEPPTLDADPSPYSGVFNATFTHRPAADVLFDYGHYERRPNPDPNKSTTSASPVKSGLVCWVVSNFMSFNYRMTYVRELQKHVNVTVYGSGQGRKCPGHHQNEECLRIISTYKFYLAFENSFCWNYVTEKVWKVLPLRVVPVVMGFANYTRLLPPGSFIDVRDFNAPGQLARYLKYLDTNATAYEEYFKWKLLYFVPKLHAHIQYRMCQLCEFAHRKWGTQQIVGKLWDRKEECISNDQYYRGVADVKYGFHDILWL